MSVWIIWEPSSGESVEFLCKTVKYLDYLTSSIRKKYLTVLWSAAILLLYSRYTEITKSNKTVYLLPAFVWFDCQKVVSRSRDIVLKISKMTPILKRYWRFGHQTNWTEVWNSVCKMRRLCEHNLTIIDISVWSPLRSTNSQRKMLSSLSVSKMI